MKTPLILSSLIVVAASFDLSAAIVTWDGGSTQGPQWSSGPNWVGDTAPSPTDATADLRFAGSTRLDAQADQAWIMRSLGFNLGSGAFLLQGSALTVGTGGIANSDDSTQTVGNPVVLGSAQTWTATGGGTLVVNGAVDTGANLLTVQPTSGRVQIGGAISGTGGILKIGTDTMVLSGAAANTYTGTTTVNGGTLVLQKTAGIVAVPGNLVIGDGSGTDTVMVDTANQIGDTSDVTINTSAVLDLDNNAETIGRLSVANGSVTSVVAGGTLSVSGLTMMGGTITNSVSLTLRGDAATTANATSATVAANTDLDAAIRIFNVADGAAAVDLTVNNLSNGGLTKTGTGTMRLAGNAANTLPLDVTVNGGVLELSKAAGVNAIVGPLTIGSGGTVRLLAANQLLDAVDVTVNGGTLDLNDFAERFDMLTMAGGAVNSGTATLTLGGNLNLSASGATPALISGKVDLAGDVRTVTVGDSDTANPDAQISAVISNGTIVKDGLGTLLLSPANTFAGGLTVSAGEVAFGNNAAAGPGVLTLNGGGAIRAVGQPKTLTNLVTLGGDAGVSGSVDLTLSGAITVTGNSTLEISNTATTTFSGAIGEDAAGRSLTKSGPGTLRFSGTLANTYTGTTTVRQGTLQLGKTAGVNAIAGPLSITGGTARLLASNQIPDTTDVAIATGALALDTFSEKIQNLTLSPGDVTGGGKLILGGTVTSGGDGLNELQVDVDLGGVPRVFTVDEIATRAVEFSITGVVSNGAITKAGPGTMRLLGTNTYTGPTLVNAGVLLVNGNIAGSTTTVSNDATLGGNGTAGVVTLEMTSHLAPGNLGVGTLTTSGLTLAEGTISQFDLAAPGTIGGGTNDLVVAGALVLDGTLAVTERTGFGDGTYTLFDYSGALTNNGLNLQDTFLTAHPGSTIAIDDTNTRVLLVVLPEPSAALWLAAALGPLVGCRRRSRRAVS